MERNESQCYAITLNNERCKNNTIKGSKWCKIHFDSCQAKRKAYKKSCEIIRDDKVKCRNLNVSDLSLSELDSIIKNYQKLINLSNRCLSSRENFEDVCIVKELQNLGHTNFKNRLELKKTKCEKNLNNLALSRCKKVVPKNEISSDCNSDENIEVVSIPTEKKKNLKSSKKRKTKEDVDDIDIILEFLKQDSKHFKQEMDIIEEYKNTFKKLYNEIEDIGYKFVEEQLIKKQLSQKTLEKIC